MSDRAKAKSLYEQALQCMEPGGLKADALRLLNAAVEADPTFPDPHDALADVYASMGRADESIAEMKKYGELKSADKSK